MAKGKLTDRQRRILDYIQDFSTENGYPPSIRQIGASVGISSTSVVNYNLNRLVEDKLIQFASRRKQFSKGAGDESEAGWF